MAPKKTAKVASKNSPSRRTGATISTYNGKQVVKVKVRTRQDGKMLSFSVPAYKEEAVAGKPNLFVKENNSMIMWADIKTDI